MNFVLFVKKKKKTQMEGIIVFALQFEQFTVYIHIYTVALRGLRTVFF